MVQLAGPAFDAFKGHLLELYADFTGTTVAQVSLTRKMMQTIKLGVHSEMTFEKGIFAIIRSLMHLAGMVLSLPGIGSRPTYYQAAVHAICYASA